MQVKGTRVPPDVQHRGACKGVDPELFFGLSDSAVAGAKEVCARCPVVEVCRTYAVKHEEFGVWGGLSEDERRALRRRGRAA